MTKDMTKDLVKKNLFGTTVCVCGLLIASGCGSSKEYDLGLAKQ